MTLLNNSIKVIGIGQSLRGDDGAGLEAVRLWHTTYHATRPHPEVQMELAELPDIGLIDFLAGARLAILVDAVHSTSAPGTIHVLSEDDIAAFPADSGSAHGWGVAETLTLGRQLFSASMPLKLVLIGIEAASLGLGDTLSPQVQSALPEAARLIEQYVIDETGSG